jgi:hypothetical protein
MPVHRRNKLVKFDWSTVAQNVISGSVGAMLVMSVAHAQRQTPDVLPEVSAHRFNLVDDAGTVCGWWSADKEEVALKMFHDKARTSLVNNGEHALLTVMFATGKEIANSSSMGSSGKSSSILLADDQNRGSIGAFSGQDVQDVVIRGKHARLELQDEEKQARVVLGQGTVGRDKGHRTAELPLSSISLFDKDGRYKWGRF